MTPTSVAAYLKRRRWNTSVMSLRMQASLQRVTSNELGKEQKDTYPYSTFQRRKRGKLYGTRVCATSHNVASLAQPGRTGGTFLGQQLT